MEFQSLVKQKNAELVRVARLVVDELGYQSRVMPYVLAVPQPAVLQNFLLNQMVLRNISPQLHQEAKTIVLQYRLIALVCDMVPRLRCGFPRFNWALMFIHDLAGLFSSEELAAMAQRVAKELHYAKSRDICPSGDCIALLREFCEEVMLPSEQIQSILKSAAF